MWKFWMSLLLVLGTEALAEVPAEWVASEVCGLEELDSRGELRERFALNLIPSVTVGFPGVLDLQVAPEIEFLWERVEAISE